MSWPVASIVLGLAFIGLGFFHAWRAHRIRESELELRRGTEGLEARVSSLEAKVVAINNRMGPLRR